MQVSADKCYARLCIGSDLSVRRGQGTRGAQLYSPVGEFYCFAVLFSYRRVVLPDGSSGEYNITVSVANNITLPHGNYLPRGIFFASSGNIPRRAEKGISLLSPSCSSYLFFCESLYRPQAPSVVCDASSLSEGALSYAALFLSFLMHR